MCPTVDTQNKKNLKGRNFGVFYKFQIVRHFKAAAFQLSNNFTINLYLSTLSQTGLP